LALATIFADISRLREVVIMLAKLSGNFVSIRTKFV